MSLDTPDSDSPSSFSGTSSIEEEIEEEKEGYDGKDLKMKVLSLNERMRG